MNKSIMLNIYELLKKYQNENTISNLDFFENLERNYTIKYTCNGSEYILELLEV